jgi:hypothetical protein
LLGHVGRLQVFVLDRVVLPHQRARGLVVAVHPCPPHPLLRAGEQVDCRAPPVAACDPSPDAPLRTLQVPLRHPQDAYVGDGLPHPPAWQTTPGRGQCRWRPRCVAGADTALLRTSWRPPPWASRLSVTVLGGALQGTRPPDRHAPARGADQQAHVEPCPSALLLVRAALDALAAREAGQARLLAALHPSKERLVGPIQSREHVLEHVAEEGSVPGQLRAEGLPLRFLLGARDGNRTTLPGGAALVAGTSVERAAAHHDARHLPFLGRSGEELVPVGRAACRLIAPTCVFQPGPTISGGRQDFWLKPVAAGYSPIRSVVCVYTVGGVEAAPARISTTCVYLHAHLQVLEIRN